MPVRPNYHEESGERRTRHRPSRRSLSLTRIRAASTDPGGDFRAALTTSTSERLKLNSAYLSATWAPPEKNESCSSTVVSVVDFGTSNTTFPTTLSPGLMILRNVWVLALA